MWPKIPCTNWNGRKPRSPADITSQRAVMESPKYTTGQASIWQQRSAHFRAKLTHTPTNVVYFLSSSPHMTRDTRSIRAWSAIWQFCCCFRYKKIKRCTSVSCVGQPHGQSQDQPVWPLLAFWVRGACHGFTKDCNYLPAEICRAKVIWSKAIFFYLLLVYSFHCLSMSWYCWLKLKENCSIFANLWNKEHHFKISHNRDLWTLTPSCL